ncbi:uncharacterized protein K452DRAFT_312275 [Aplosporella prunicola CBS 121167]|uniref:Kelch repeat protein n=1 Tax=Aplosporella prunicola CBS 121167 TaxID=1176127 RepID=A0A6A6B0A3_9PEZI|nr:uncharacterized protein K452DRAFT_312275 [Aplosporella prunicola CBS 121167]KAF2137450.1 hypothetical protein K452DRAFT_312275 [Aplosporella prunicola CBS 121167]
MAESVRVALHGSIVIGDFVYIDGGLQAQRVNGQFSNLSLNTKTLSIDMRTSWTNTTVNVSSIDNDGSPPFFHCSHWPDESSGSFYSWTGEVPAGSMVPQKSFWKFTCDGKGGGKWTRQPDTDTFQQLTWPVSGYSTTVDGADNVGFETADIIPVPGVVSYNFSTSQWNNKSTERWNQYGTGIFGQAAEVPFAEGLLVLVGGESGSRTSITNKGGYIDFRSLSIYDTATGNWYLQVTTGEAPSIRDSFCLAGVRGENSYELFIFGGWLRAAGELYNDSYVLSLPAFHWFKGPTNTPPRKGHTCHAVGGGQVIVIGGYNRVVNDTLVWEEQDPWDHELGIFDLTAMEWKDRYNATAAAYESPKEVKSWYADAKNPEPNWTSETVRALFARMTPMDSSATPPKNPTISSSAVSSSSTHKSWTAIILGTVVGSITMVVSLAVLLVL